METTSRERLLKNVRNAIISKSSPPFENVDFDSSVYVEHQTPYPDIIFAEEFSKVGGKFVYCEDENELITNLIYLFNAYNYHQVYCADNEIKEILTLAKIPYVDGVDSLLKADAGITYCEFMIARFGSIMISSRQAQGRKGIIFPPVHIVLAFTSQIVMEIKEAFNKMKVKYNNKLPSMISLITGPSRTADIEKTLVMGAHGPKELYVFLIEDRKK
ncbi:MAG: lactate utilization protein [Bacteroidales bacterium]|nr:lactate utilization protein [Bacteroidales bacterium]